jgi:excinuclease ABC subunit C
MAKQVAAYKKNIAAVKEILSGKKKSLIKKFEKEMNALAKMGNLEKAIELRDKIEKLKKVFENAKIINQNKYYDISLYHSGKSKSLIELKRFFKLPALPRRIEGYDVSNIQGKFATGAMVVFVNGQPDKKEYRKFKIRTTDGDTGMLQEIITRRFGHPEWLLPDLILIDGGKGQLNAAVSVLRTSKQKISVIALTKNIRHRGDHIYASTKKTAMPLKNLPPAVRNLILQIDAEAHRFAIGYYRKLHKRGLVE